MFKKTVQYPRFVCKYSNTLVFKCPTHKCFDLLAKKDHKQWLALGVVTWFRSILFVRVEDTFPLFTAGPERKTMGAGSQSTLYAHRGGTCMLRPAHVCALGCDLWVFSRTVCVCFDLRVKFRKELSSYTKAWLYQIQSGRRWLGGQRVGTVCWMTWDQVPSPPTS